MSTSILTLGFYSFKQWKQRIDRSDYAHHKNGSMHRKVRIIIRELLAVIRACKLR